MMKKNNIRLKAGLAGLLMPVLAFAGDMGPEPKWNHLYFGIDGGYSMSLNSANFNPYNGSQVNGNVISVPTNTTFQRDIGNAGMLGGYIGYNVNENLSFNINYDYRSGFDWQVPVSYGTPGSAGVIFFTNNIKIQTAFVNFILNPSVNWGGLMPYVNGGVGFAVNDVGVIHDFVLDNSSNGVNYNGKSVTNFAWNAGLGVDYAITKKLHYTLGYRLVNAGPIESADTFSFKGNPNVSGRMTPFKSSQILLNEVITSFKWQYDA